MLDIQFLVGPPPYLPLLLVHCVLTWCRESSQVSPPIRTLFPSYQGPTLMTCFNLSYVHVDPISKCSNVRVWPSAYEFEGGYIVKSRAVINTKSQTISFIIGILGRTPMKILIITSF